jgi:hypothetical protein
MAKFTSNYEVEGSLLNQTYYKKGGKIFIKRKSGVNKEKILTDPAFDRTRENGAEFGSSARSGKLLRYAFSPLLKNTADKLVVSRLTQTMTKVKNLDTTSIRGMRNVANGITNPLCRPLFIDFNFNRNAILKSILRKPYTVDTGTGEIDIPGFTPIVDITIPEGATNLALTGALGSVDFSGGTYEVYYSKEVNLPYDGTVTDVSLVPSSVPVLKGAKFYLLHIAYFQQVNGVQYPLNNGAYNSLAIVELV